MCLITTKPAKIADKPIIVYKVLLLLSPKKYQTPCQGNVVMINDTLKAVVDTEPHKTYEYNRTICTIKGEGVHAYTSKEFAKATCLSYHVITEWEIPACAKYWEGTGGWEGEIAATEMKFVKVCEDYKHFLA